MLDEVEFERRLLDRYTAVDLVELLGLETADIMDRFWEELMGNRAIQEEVGIEG